MLTSGSIPATRSPITGGLPNKAPLSKSLALPIALPTPCFRIVLGFPPDSFSNLPNSVPFCVRVTGTSDACPLICPRIRDGI